MCVGCVCVVGCVCGGGGVGVQEVIPQAAVGGGGGWNLGVGGQPALPRAVVGGTGSGDRSGWQQRVGRLAGSGGGWSGG